MNAEEQRLILGHIKQFYELFDSAVVFGHCVSTAITQALNEANMF